MSGKNNGVPHQLLDRLVKFEATWTSKLSEVVKKHNDLASQITALETVIKQVATFTAAELGKFGGTLEGQGLKNDQIFSGFDLNILALAEIQKEVIGQLTQIDAIFKKFHGTLSTLLQSRWPKAPGAMAVALTNDDIAAFYNALELAESEVSQIKTDAEDWFKDITSSAFKTVKERLEAEAKAQQEAQERAKVEAERTATAQAEAQTVEHELKKANDAERIVVATTSGGPGTSYPEGADIWGG